ncbi:uncharacterized protein EI90DRAFT_3128440 [Cantharellus anzutake]|uniref:uncharacterized protein n=1 Tax=Cantharellus anzutake TaxID=1750568 RepID=UPI0019059365|nr:uncharacterized protein EI90DRAFT_3128440 [Cantharellus anzutake]KAF8325902.1 hypothetical protein EI90DRAFT_3128440 [Cantharellus anzutake]
MADTKDATFLSNPPGYSPLPTVNPAASKDERVDEQPAPNKCKRCSCARHFWRFISIGFVIFIIAKGIKYLWRGSGQHLKSPYEDDYIMRVYDFSGDFDLYHGDDDDHPKPHCTKWRNSTMPGETTYHLNVSAAAEVIKLVSGGGFKGTVDYVIADKDLGDTIGVKIALSAPAKIEEPETDLAVHSWWKRLKHKKHKIKGPKAYVCTIPTPEGNVKGVVLSRKPPHHGHHGHRPWRSLPPDPLEEFLSPSLPDAGMSIPPPPSSEHCLPPPLYPGDLREVWVDGKHPHRRCHPTAPVTAKIVVTLPRGHLELASFSSVFPHFAQHINGAFDDAVFGKLFVVGATSGLPRRVKADVASIIAEGNPINGTYVVKDRLELVTAGAPITVNVTLLSDATAYKHTRLNIANRNGSVDAEVQLVAVGPSKDTVNGLFSINTFTSHRLAKVNVTSFPLGGYLAFDVVNRYGEIVVTVPPSYEGRFGLVNRGGTSIAKSDKDTKDPSGKGRNRVILVRNIVGGIVDGFIGWADDPEDGVTIGKVDAEEFEVSGEGEQGWDEYFAEFVPPIYSDHIYRDPMFTDSRIDLVSTKGIVLLDLN